MHFILTTIGSAGDAFPFIGLGRELVARGHDVVVLANEQFSAPAEEAGIRVRPHSSAAEYQAAIANPELFDLRNGFKTIAAYVSRLLPTLYRLLEDEFRPGRTILAAHWFDFAARVFQERHAAPLATVLLQPLLLRSVFDTPTLQIGSDINRLPHRLKRVIFWAADRWVVDPQLVPALNALRASVQLRPIARPLDRWMFSPDLTVGMWPSVFAPPQPDWPASVRLTGFPLFDAAAPVPADVSEFLDSGPPPILFTQGTAMRESGAFFAAAVDACARLGRRGLLVSGFGEPIASLPTTMHFARFAPFSRVLPRCAALVHHGGVGTTAAGLAAGVPQLITPLSHDQPDHAVRIRRLGVGDWLLPRDVSAGALEAKLRPLLGVPAVGERCAAVAGEVRASDGIATAATLVESIGARAPSAVS